MGRKLCAGLSVYNLFIFVRGPSFIYADQTTEIRPAEQQLLHRTVCLLCDIEHDFVKFFEIELVRVIIVSDVLGTVRPPKDVCRLVGSNRVRRESQRIQEHLKLSQIDALVSRAQTRDDVVLITFRETRKQGQQMLARPNTKHESRFSSEIHVQVLSLLYIVSVSHGMSC